MHVVNGDPIHVCQFTPNLLRSRNTEDQGMMQMLSICDPADASCDITNPQEQDKTEAYVPSPKVVSH